MSLFMTLNITIMYRFLNKLNRTNVTAKHVKNIQCLQLLFKSEKRFQCEICKKKLDDKKNKKKPSRYDRITQSHVSDTLTINYFVVPLRVAFFLHSDTK